MIEPKDFFDELKRNNFTRYVGVPDSLLKSFCGYVHDHASDHIITSNEGTAIAVATGQYLKSKMPSVVYLQNSGIGNCVNPLLSLNDEAVYSLPVLLLIGWRGEPGVKDEPQHSKQGLIMEPLLKSIGLQYSLLDHASSVKQIVGDAAKYINLYKKPFAILVRKNTFSDYKIVSNEDNFSDQGYPSRENILKTILKSFGDKTLFISSTGVTSRELFEIRESFGQGHEKDFLTVGSMGHASAIAQGLCSVERTEKIICVDGDGSVLMHLGSLSLNFNVCAKNYTHILINNSCHDSVGGQPTVASKINFDGLAKSLGYSNYFEAKSLDEVKIACDHLENIDGPNFFHIYSQKGYRKDLGRPTILPKDNVRDFMKNL